MPVLFWILGEGAVLYEMTATGAANRAELEDDFGLGFIFLFLVLPGTLIGAVVVGLVTWFISRRMDKEDNENA